ncbi:MAG: UDP-N-acetylmuramoyl-L-alanyl-D-glutamate--2,6-diaminopimelate ligase [Nitriliruptoraceae bacterium]
MSALLSDVVTALPRVEQAAGLRDDVLLVDATHDSRQVRDGWLFCAVPGARSDGHDHAPQAVADGAAALLVERWLELEVPQLMVPSVRAAMGPAAAVIHGDPSRELTVVGTTGTNGKTTVSYLLEGAFAAAGRGTGVIGTVETRIHGEAVPGVRTTPEGTDLQRLLRHFHDRGVDAVAIEVSSHGLDLHRVDGTHMTVAIYTNLSQDHLDWHGSMAAYLAAKARLFTSELSARGVVFLDSAWAGALLEAAEVPVTTVGRDPLPAGLEGHTPDVLLAEETTGVDGGRALLHGLTPEPLAIATGLPGRFNLANAAVAVVAAVQAGVEVADAVAGVAAAPGAPGRLERVEVGQAATVLVDYAHTSDAVAEVIRTLRGVLPDGGRLTVVLGCGGDRDRGKRGPMGAAAAQADRAVLTSDNPRSEDPLAILDAVEAGARAAVGGGAPATIQVVADRREAIAAAVADTGRADVVLLAGKGHEATQELADRTVSFDDRLVAAEVLVALIEEGRA